MVELAVIPGLTALPPLPNLCSCVLAEGSGDYTWLLIVVPLLLLVARLILQPGTQPVYTAFQQAPAPPQPHTDEEVSHEEDIDCTEPGALAGPWAGTVFVHPSTHDQPMQVYRLDLELRGDPLAARVLQPTPPVTGKGIVQASVLEYEPTTGNLDLQLRIVEAGRERTCIAALTYDQGVFVPYDDSDAVTAELRRYRPVPSNPDLN